MFHRSIESFYFGFRITVRSVSVRNAAEAGQRDHLSLLQREQWKVEVVEQQANGREKESPSAGSRRATRTPEFSVPLDEQRREREARRSAWESAARWIGNYLPFTSTTQELSTEFLLFRPAAIDIFDEDRKVLNAAARGVGVAESGPGPSPQQQLHQGGPDAVWARLFRQMQALLQEARRATERIGWSSAEQDEAIKPGATNMVATVLALKQKCLSNYQLWEDIFGLGKAVWVRFQQPELRWSVESYRMMESMEADIRYLLPKLRGGVSVTFLSLKVTLLAYRRSERARILSDFVQRRDQLRQHLWQLPGPNGLLNEVYAESKDIFLAGKSKINGRRTKHDMSTSLESALWLRIEVLTKVPVHPEDPPARKIDKQVLINVHRTCDGVDELLLPADSRRHGMVARSRGEHQQRAARERQREQALAREKQAQTRRRMDFEWELLRLLFDFDLDYTSDVALHALGFDIRWDRERAEEQHEEELLQRQHQEPLHKDPHPEHQVEQRRAQDQEDPQMGGGGSVFIPNRRGHQPNSDPLGGASRGAHGEDEQDVDTSPLEGGGRGAPGAPRHRKNEEQMKGFSQALDTDRMTLFRLQEELGLKGLEFTRDSLHLCFGLLVDVLFKVFTGATAMTEQMNGLTTRSSASSSSSTTRTSFHPGSAATMTSSPAQKSRVPTFLPAGWEIKRDPGRVGGKVEQALQLQEQHDHVEGRERQPSNNNKDNKVLSKHEQMEPDADMNEADKKFQEACQIDHHVDVRTTGRPETRSKTSPTRSAQKTHPPHQFDDEAVERAARELRNLCLVGRPRPPQVESTSSSPFSARRNEIRRPKKQDPAVVPPSQEYCSMSPEMSFIEGKRILQKAADLCMDINPLLGILGTTTTRLFKKSTAGVDSKPGHAPGGPASSDGTGKMKGAPAVPVEALTTQEMFDKLISLFEQKFVPACSAKVQSKTGGSMFGGGSPSTSAAWPSSLLGQVRFLPEL
ncbi:unnamed protein product [Amoebophrya sp. A120]|nr:unnamed protein product [Amoebophrya sp. A120]|eukprot:GSA120T00017455001.1